MTPRGAASGTSTPPRPVAGRQPSPGKIAGAGSSAQDAAQQAWIAGFQATNPDATISYDPVGSGGGREQFVAGGVAYGGTDVGLADDELDGRPEALRRRRQPGRDPGLRLADRGHLQPAGRRQTSSSRPTTLAKIFAQKITNWNDPAIAADNPDATLPDTRITAGQPLRRVGHHARTSPTTCRRPRRTSGRYEAGGDWPVKGGEAAAGHLRRRRRRQGRQGHDRLRRREPGRRARRRQDQGRRRVRRARRAEAAAAIVDESHRRPTTRASTCSRTTLDRTTTAAGTYPIVLVSYLMACTQVRRRRPGRARQGATSSYVISAEGQAGRGQERRLGPDQRRAAHDRSSRPSTRSPRADARPQRTGVDGQP